MNDNKMQLVQGTRYFGAFHIFSGSAGGALGFQNAFHEHRGVIGRYKTLGGIDVDPDCCEDFQRLTGVPATCLDLFDRDMYCHFWGKEPPEDWREATAEDFRKAAGGVFPDVVFLSPPCKGFSGLLPEKTSKQPKYQALNRLVIRSMQLTLEAFKDDLPAAILIENVPRIKQRGASLLQDVKTLLGAFGYEFTEGTHDCGVLGGLGQTRKRFLLICRNPKKLQSFIYEPPKLELRSIGDVLKDLPSPGDVEVAGAMHRLPNLQWKTWVRLALIPAGKDWRALNGEGVANSYRIVPWEKASATVTGAVGVPQGALNVADPRLDTVQGYGNKFNVTAENEPSPTVTGSRIGSGAVLVADAKLGYQARRGTFRVVQFDETSPTITGTTGAGRSNSLSGVADPRLPDAPGRYSGKFKVEDWSDPARTVTCDTDIQTGALAVQDARYNDGAFHNNLKVQPFDEPAGTITPRHNHVADPRLTARPARRSGSYKVSDWEKPSGTVTGQPDVQNSGISVADPRITGTPFSDKLRANDWEKPAVAVTSGTGYVCDPRIACKPRSGAYGVQDWNETSKTVPGNFDIDNSPASVADPRAAAVMDSTGELPKETDRGVWMIIAEDGTWHRPVTTFEMAMLQSLPPTFPDGSPLVLAGNSETKWREHIGNMVPPATAKAIGSTILQTMMPNMIFDEWHWNYEPEAAIWVRPGMEHEEAERRV